MAQYSSRNLTDPADIANAFAGIGIAIRQRLGWRFLLGIPSAVLDLALLWLPWGFLKRWRRRAQPDKVSTNALPQLLGPGWSWMAWEGKAAYSKYVYDSRLLFRRVRPAVQQFTVRVGTDGNVIPVPQRVLEIWYPEVNTRLKAS